MSWSSPFEYSEAVEHHVVLDLKAGEIPTWSDSYSDSEEVDAVTERIDSEPDRYADIEPPDSSEQWQWTAARHLRHPAQHAVPTVCAGPRLTFGGHARGRAAQDAATEGPSLDTSSGECRPPTGHGSNVVLGTLPPTGGALR